MLLQKRSNGYFYFRWVVPPRLRKLFRQTEFIRSLGTKNRLHAQMLSHNLLTEVLVIKGLMERVSNFTEDDYRELLKGALERLRNYHRVEKRYYPHGWVDGELEKANSYFDVLNDSREDGQFRLPISSCQTELRMSSVDIDSVPEIYHGRLASDLLVGQFRAIQERIEQLEGLMSKKAVAAAANFSFEVESQEKYLFRDLFADFMHSKLSLSGLGSAMEKEYRSYFVYMDHFLGDMPIDEIKRTDLVSMMDNLAYMPTRNKSPYLKMSPGQIFKLIEERSVGESDRIKVSTVGQYRRLLQGMFSFAVNSGRLNVSPASKITPSNAISEGDRDPFDVHELRRLEKSVLNMDKFSWRNKVSKKWIVLIVMYSGARLGEIVGLRVKDIKCDGNYQCWYFDHCKESGATKNENAPRVVPIHSRLIELGFIEFVGGISAESRVFSDIKSAEPITKWFSKLQKASDVGFKSINGGDLVFHSLRHSFVTIVRNNGARQHIFQQVVGHEVTGAGTSDGYTGKASLSERRDVVEIFSIS